MASDFLSMWRDLEPIGRSAQTGGYFRQPWESAELELRSWFRESANQRGLEITEDPFGNMIAWWGDPDDSQKILTGSHLDSVLDGGAFDGPLGVVSAVAAIDLMRERGVQPAHAIGIAVFVEEEGSRFGRACLGSRLATGATSWAEVRELQDRDGIRLGDVIPGGEVKALTGVKAYVELHVEQGRALVDRDSAVGIGNFIWPHGRYRFEITGRGDHAGTTRMEDRADPMVAFAALALAADNQARESGQRATFGRLAVHPNSTNSIPAHLTAWLDARAESAAELEDLVSGIKNHAEVYSVKNHTRVDVHTESESAAVNFDNSLVRSMHSMLGEVPILATAAGHDAAIMQEAGIPSAMLFVRNPSGTSHSPAEVAGLDDCLAGVDALADVLTGLVS